MMKRQRWRKPLQTVGFMALLLLCISLPLTGYADDFDEYAPAATTIDLPPAGGFFGNYSWFTASEYFPANTPVAIDNFQAQGRILAATGKELYLQRNYGSGGSAWDVVATVAGGNMDPSFVRISPDGSTIALGIGFNAPLMVFPTSILSINNPPVLDTHPQVTAYAVNYYDAAWADNRYLLVNGGQWPGPPYASGVGVLDTTNPADTGTGLIDNIPGASAGIAVDRVNNRLITGIGYAPAGGGNPNRTGEIKLWNAGEWSTTPSTALDYETNPKVLAQNVLSAAYLAFDKEGNVTVGGGDAFGTGGVGENGYAAVIRKDPAVDRVAAGGAPVNDGDWSDTAEYRVLASDPCMNDSATGIVYGGWGEALAVVWNPLTMPSGCAGVPGSAGEFWNQGVIPRITVHYPDNPPDQDSDGVPDASDNAYLTANSGQEDADGDGYGNMVDADFNNDNVVNFSDFNTLKAEWLGSDPVADMNADGVVNFSDYNLLKDRWLQPAPYY